MYCLSWTSLTESLSRWNIITDFIYNTLLTSQLWMFFYLSNKGDHSHQRVHLETATRLKSKRAVWWQNDCIWRDGTKASNNIEKKHWIIHILNSLSGLVKFSLQKLLHFWKLFLSMEFGKTSFKHVLYLQPKNTQLNNNNS